MFRNNYKDLKLAYSQLGEYKENLEKKVRERTKEQEELLTAEMDNIVEIIDYWEKEQEKGNFDAYLSKISQDEDTNRNITYGEEDIHILRVITDTIKKVYENARSDMFFILKNLTRVIKIINELRLRLMSL